MNYNDSSFIITLFIIPSLFGFTLIGEGVSKIMNYDGHGWIGVSVGAIFILTIIIAYFLFNTKTLF